MCAERRSDGAPQWPRLLWVVIIGATAGCHTTLSPRDLPLFGSVYQEVVGPLARRAGGGNAEALRDLRWLRLLYGGGSVAAPEPGGQSVAFDPRDLRAVLYRALVLQFGGARCEAVDVWVALLERCRSGPRGECGTLRGAALAFLSQLGEECDPLRPEPLEGVLGADLDPWQREQILILLTRIATKAGRTVQQKRYSGLRGCPARWRVLPLGQEVFGVAESDVEQRGAGGLQRTDMCGLELHSEGPSGGRFRLTSDAWGGGRKHASLIITSDATWRLSLDGHQLHHHRPQRRGVAQRVQLQLGWSPGRHRFELEVKTVQEQAKVQLSLVDAQGRSATFNAPRGASPRVAAPPQLQLRSCADDPERLIASGWPVWMLPVAQYLAAVQAHRCRDLDRAFSELAAARRLAPRFALPHLLYLQTLSDDPAYPGELRRQDAETLVARLLEGDPDLGEAALQRAKLAQEGQRPRRTLNMLKEGALKWPQDVRWHRGLQEHYRERSFHVEEAGALMQLLERRPAHCGALEDLSVLRQSERDFVAAKELARKAAACDATAETLLRQYLEGGRVKAALAEVRRLTALRPGDLTLQRQQAMILVRLGRHREAGEALAGLLRRDAGTTEDMVMAADLLAAEGRHAEAIRSLRDAYRRWPWRESLSRALERLTGVPPLQEFRLDGAEVIREFQRAARSRRSPAVMVQDRVVSRLHANGSASSLTHNIVQVLSKEGIDRWGEIQVPKGAEVLTLRTVKRDGRILQPEEIIGKDSVSMPDLAVGDFVEMEYLEAYRPSAAASGSAVQRFFFRSAELPLWHSEFVLLSPAGAPLQVESWGGAPPVRRGVHGKEQMLRWLARDQPRLILEPRTVHLEELLPAVSVAMGGSWERWRGYFRARLEEATRSSWHLVRIARELSRGHRGKAARARAIYRGVLARVEAEGEIFEDATRSVLAGRGSRAAALVGLLRSEDIPAELWMVRPRTASWRERRVPDVQNFSVPLVRCQLPGGPVFLDPRNQATPFGYVRPALRGAVALRAAAGEALFGQVPTTPTLSRDSQKLKIQVVLSRSGEGRVEVEERHLGLDAQRWRLALRKMDRDAVQRSFEQGTLGFYFPGALLERLEVLDAERADEPLIVKYAFTAPGLGRPAGGGLLVTGGLFPPTLGRRYLQLHQRKSPLVMDFHPQRVMEVKIIAPPGMAPAAPGGDLELRGPFGLLRRVTLPPRGGELTCRWELRLIYGRVSPDRYPAFRRFARAVDARFKEEILFTDRRAAPAPRPGR